MRKIIVAALSVIFFVIISVYFGISTTGLFSSAEFQNFEEAKEDENDSEWKLVGKIDVRLGNVTTLP